MRKILMIAAAGASALAIALTGVGPAQAADPTCTVQTPCFISIAQSQYAPQVVDGQLVVPDVEGVVYTVIDRGTYWRIEAMPEPGYILLAEGLPVVWERQKPPSDDCKHKPNAARGNAYGWHRGHR